MSPRRSSLSIALLGLALLGGCPEPEGTTDAATGGDAGTPPGTDAGPDVDAGDVDGGSSVDAGGGTDGGPPTGPTLLSLAAGQASTCAVLEDGTARCWGDNREGQLGDGTTTSSVTPVEVSGLTDAIAISTGYETSCAIRAGGAVVCWGSGTNGKLGNGANDDSLVPVPVTGLSGAVQIRVGFSTVCALLDDDSVWCWGRGGELGDGSVTESNVPVAVPTLLDVAELAAASHGGTSASSHTCGIRLDGAAFCWGRNPDGQNGDGTQDDARAPVAVVDITGVTAIATGMNHACAVHSSGVSCWGASQTIGDGTVERRFRPTPVSTSIAFADLTAGFQHTCGRTAGGDLWCWGLNNQGQIGDGEDLVIGDVRLTPVQADVTNVALVAAGMFHTCAHTDDGRTYCWGENEYGETGSGEPGSSARSGVPALVAW